MSIQIEINDPTDTILEINDILPEPPHPPDQTQTQQPQIIPQPLSSQNIETTTEIKTINGWTKQNQTYFQFCLHRLKYYRIINNFFYFELKKQEGHYSWAIIVISSFSSVLSLINTSSDIFPHSAILVKWSLVLLTLITTLISAYIKKQQYIEKINNIDRYLQQLNHIVEELNITFILEPNKRENYDEFCKKYIPIIKNLSVAPATFSPPKWKQTVYTITKYYPELINGDGTNGELLWPWYYMGDMESVDKIPENKKRGKSKFGETVIRSYRKLKNTTHIENPYTFNHFS
jgi:hypothetical protein